jgi:hypothetical protein
METTRDGTRAILLQLHFPPGRPPRDEMAASAFGPSSENPVDCVSEQKRTQREEPHGRHYEGRGRWNVFHAGVSESNTLGSMSLYGK